MGLPMGFTGLPPFRGGAFDGATTRDLLVTITTPFGG